ncbi:hypothetical protein AGLY_007721 [Aphis glycines]|uniref:Uncharacterized protein n=1 Tax=Aphis glycines TaxID=307491 RepID=A0A6G0TQ43_APHGL|nr:hypothetical protein AGLY_007721 [Aphis glycines]
MYVKNKMLPLFDCTKTNVTSVLTIPSLYFNSPRFSSKVIASLSIASEFLFWRHNITAFNSIISSIRSGYFFSIDQCKTTMVQHDSFQLPGIQLCIQIVLLCHGLIFVSNNLLQLALLGFLLLLLLPLPMYFYMIWQPDRYTCNVIHKFVSVMLFNSWNLCAGLGSSFISSNASSERFKRYKQYAFSNANFLENDKFR